MVHACGVLLGGGGLGAGARARGDEVARDTGGGEATAAARAGGEAATVRWLARGAHAAARGANAGRGGKGVRAAEEPSAWAQPAPWCCEHLRLGARALVDEVVEGRADAEAAVRASLGRGMGMDMGAGAARAGSSTAATGPGSPMSQGLATRGAPAGRFLRAASLRAAMRARSSAVRAVSKVEDLSLGTSACQSPPCVCSS